MVMEMLDSLNKVVNAIHKLQDQHLLTAGQREDFFICLKDIAQQKNVELIIFKPSDLFQLEVYYIFLW